MSSRMTDARTTSPRPSRLVSLWEEFRRTRSAEARRDLMAAYVPLVQREALRFKCGAGLPHCVELGDLVSDGMFGLADAIEKFDPARYVRFTTYAPRRIRGAIVDGLREYDWIPRLTRTRDARWNAAWQDAATRLGRKPTDAEVATRLRPGELVEPAPPAVGSVNAPVAEGETRSVRLHDVLCPVDEAESDPVAPIARREVLRRLTAGMRRAERLVIVLYHFEDMTMKEVAGVLGLTESRVSQMHTNLLARIRSESSRDELEELLAAG